MKRIVENFRDFIVSAGIHQEPGAWKLYSANPRGNDRDMIEGVIDIIRKVRDKSNRNDIATYMLEKFKEENVEVDPIDFMKSCGLS